MDKNQYLEMCEMLGNEPIEEEIPVEIEDFPALIQQTITIFHMLTDIWDPMGGNYLGKDTQNVFDFFKLYEFQPEEIHLVLPILRHIDNIRQKIIASKKQATKPSSK